MSKKKNKPKPFESPKMARTVKQYSTFISDFQEIKKIARRYTKVKNYVYSRYSGINSFLILNNYKKEIRDQWIQSNFAAQFNLPARYWKQALDEAISNIKSQWSNMKNSAKKAIHQNANLSNDEKFYLYYVLKVDDLFYCILTRKGFYLPKKLFPLQVREPYIHNLLRRYVRKYKGSVPYSHKETSFMIDAPMYKYKRENKNTFIEITSTKPRQRIRIGLTDSNLHHGNIRIIVKENSLELHHFIKSKQKQIWESENIVGIDKGYRTLLATSSGQLYGEKLNEFLNKETERLNEKNKKRNQYWALMEKCKKEQNLKKAEQIRANNLGRKKYDNQKQKHDATVKSYLNFSLNQFFKSENPSEVISEDLTFSNWKNKFPKYVNRKLHRWMKGYIRKRLKFKCDHWNVTFTEVNAAYTSQVCHQCGHFGKRDTDVFSCPNHGSMQADLNAGHNIKSRKEDPDITLFTPYKMVKEILEKRIAVVV